MEKGGTNKDITFANVLAILEWLQNGGWKISKSNLYIHVRDGLLLARKDAKYHLRDVSKYAKLYLKKKERSNPRSSRIDSMQEKRIAAETRKMEASARISEVKAKVIEGLYIEKSSFERDLTRRAMVFKNDIENFCQSHAPEIVRICKGDQNFISDVTEYLLEQSENWLNRYSEPREWRVPISVPEISDEDTNLSEILSQTNAEYFDDFKDNKEDDTDGDEEEICL